MDLKVDPTRRGMPETGIYVRARDTDILEHVRNADIVELDRESLFTWLKSRGGDNPWAESVVAILLGHKSQ